MANKLPYDDELAIQNDQRTEDEMDAYDQDEEQATRDAVAAKYFSNPEMPEDEGDLSQVGHMVGQKYNSPVMDDISAPQRTVAAEPAPETPEVKVPASEVVTKDKPMDPRESILSQYNELKKLQDNVSENKKGLNYALAGNQIAQAIAYGGGAKIGAGDEVLNQVKKDQDQKIVDYKDRVKNRMDVADSDVAKFYRYKLAKSIKTEDPNADISFLDNMSAHEMEDFLKLQAKNKATGRGDLFFTSIKDENGKDIVAAFSRQTGERVRTLGDKSLSDKVIVNPETGQQEIYNQVSGLKGLRDTSLPTTPTATKSQPSLPTQSPTTPPEAKKPADDIMNSPTALAKVNPKLYEQFKKDQDSFLKEVKDNRDTATAATTLASKLKPGPNGEIDSGLLGGIQTQAAKMAGQKGVLTDQDLVKFAGAGGVQAKISRIIDGSLFGEMSDDDIKFFKRFASKMQEANASDIDNRSQLIVDNVHNEAKNYLPGLTKEQVKNGWLNVGSVAPASQSAQGADAIGEVKRKTADGQIAVFDAKTKKFLRYEK